MSALMLTVVAAGLAAISLAIQWVIAGRLFPRSVALEDVLAMVNLDENDIEKGITPITQFYEWSQDRWSALAKGTGAAAVSVLVAVAGLLITAATTTTETAIGEDTSSATTTAVSLGAVPELVVLIIVLFGVALIAWLRSARIHLDYAEDLSVVVRSRQP